MAEKDEKVYGDLVKGDDNGCTPLQDFIDAKIKLNSIPKNKGIYNTPLCRTPFSYNSPAGSWLKENQGAYIVLGQIPPSSLASGYGAKGVPAESIDLVVGRNSSANQGDGPAKGSVVDNNFGTDAARIYISRLCDIDLIFGLESAYPPGAAGLEARSAIGIKADGVRIVGREGVKITTGKMRGAKFGPDGELNSLGASVGSTAPKIDLVAGNNLSLNSWSDKPHDQLQGVALGERTQLCISELSDIVGEIWTAIFNMTLTQIPTNASLIVTPWAGAAVATATSQQLTGVASLLYQSRASAMLWKNRYIGSQAPRYIVSKNVRTN